MKPEERLTSQLGPRAEALCSLRGWTLIKALGAGATAATFEVRTADGVRALKIYAPRFLVGKVGDQTRKRFEIILKHLKGHDCENLVQIYEGDEHDRTLYLLMQRAPGKCLADVLKLVPRQRIRPIMAQVASAAKFLEDLGLCHRDIKAENIVVSDDFAHAILLDLGVVRWLDDEAGAGTDQEGQLPFVATARYSSPEYMFRLIPSGRELWRALTFYQLGGLLHDLITKELLFEDVSLRRVRTDT
jgi:serine/threonine protein kinase